MGCGAVAVLPVAMRFSVVFMFCVSFRRSGTALFASTERAAPLLTKRTRLNPRRRAAEHQQRSDSGRKDVATAGARLRGATRGAGSDGMNTTNNLIGGCLISDERVGIPILHQSSKHLRKW